MSEIKIPLTEEHTLVFDSDDIETFETPHDVRDVGERNGYVEREFTGKMHVLLHFRQGAVARWEST